EAADVTGGQPAAVAEDGSQTPGSQPLPGSLLACRPAHDLPLSGFPFVLRSWQGRLGQVDAGQITEKLEQHCSSCDIRKTGHPSRIVKDVAADHREMPEINVGFLRSVNRRKEEPGELAILSNDRLIGLRHRWVNWSDEGER